MTQLTTNDKQGQVLITLPETQSALVSLRLGSASVKDLSPNVVKSACVDILTKASFDVGSTMGEDPRVLQFQTEALFSELKGKYASLTIPEIREAFNRGIRGDAGQYFGLCPRSYHLFIKWFYELPERQNAWIEYMNLINSDPDEISKNAAPNPEGQKKVVEIIKSTLAPLLANEQERKVKKKIGYQKSERDQFIQSCFAEFYQIWKKTPFKPTKKAELSLYDLKDRYDDNAMFILHTWIQKNKEGVEIEVTRPVDQVEYTQIKLTEYDTTNKNL